MRELERKASRIYTRSIEYEPKPEEVLQLQISINDLLKLYHGLVKRRLDPPVHRVVIDKVNLLERIQEIREFLRYKEGKISFFDILPPTRTKAEIITSFLAILEMVKNGEIEIIQSQNFRPIYLRRSQDNNEQNVIMPAAV